MFYNVSGEAYREVLKESDGAWIVSYENPVSPKFVSADELKNHERIEPPTEYLRLMEKETTDGQKRRIDLIVELLEDKTYISDKQLRNTKIKEIADREETTVKRIQKLFFRYLAG
ncbi:MAG: integrase, partial [Clostridium sp.]